MIKLTFDQWKKSLDELLTDPQNSDIDIIIQVQKLDLFYQSDIMKKSGLSFYEWYYMKYLKQFGQKAINEFKNNLLIRSMPDRQKGSR